MAVSSHIRQPTLRARRLTSIALAMLFAPPLWIAPAAEASPGNGWASPMDLMPSTSSGYYVDMAADRDGNAWVIWSEWTGSANPVMIRQFTQGSGWQPAFQLSQGDGYSVSVATNYLGDAFAAWTSWNGTGYNISYRRYTADWGWSAQRNLTGLDGNTYDLDTAMDGPGNGYIMAQAWNGTLYNHFAVRVSITLTVQGPVALNTPGNTSYYGHVAAGRQSGAFFVWAEYDGSNMDVYAARHTGSTLGASQLLDERPEWADWPDVGVDDYGRAIVVWDQYIGNPRLRMSRWTGSWSDPEDLAGSYYGWLPDLRVTPSGAATVAFVTVLGGVYYPAVARYYPTDTGWQTPTRGPENLTTGYAYPTLAVDAGGNPLVLWNRQQGDRYLLRASQVAGTSWASRTWLQEDTLPPSNQTNPHVEFLSGDTALAAWMQYDGTRWFLRANILHTADFVAPWVRIERPLTGAVSGIPSITVSGWAEPGSQVWVNGAAATVNQDGFFVAALAVAAGWTYLVATARDGAGNQGYSNGRLVFYQDPTASRDNERANLGRPGGQEPAPLDQLNYWGAWWAQVQTDSRGYAYATWYEYAYPSYQEYVSRYVPGAGWDQPIHLAGEEGNLHAAARFTMDRGGNLTVIWATQELNGRWSHIWAFHFMAAGWYIGPYRVDAGLRYAYWPDAAASPDGRTLMVWQQRDEVSQNYSIFGRWFDPVNFTWTTPAAIEGFNNTTEGPRVAFDGAGKAFVTARVWNTTAPTDAALLTYTPGTGWDNGSLLANTPTPASFVSIDTDRGGNSTLAWLRLINSSFFQLYSGRVFANGTWSGPQLMWNDSWNWDPEVVAVDSGHAFVAETATVNGTPDALVAVIQPGQSVANMTRMDNGTGWGGGPKLSEGYADGTVRAHFDELEGALWRANMRSYSFTTGNWSAVWRLSPDDRGGHIPDVAPMPDGGMMVVWNEDNATLGSLQTVARRFTPPDLTAPALSVTSPANGTLTNLSSVRVSGVAEVGARVWVNGVPAVVAANGSFVMDVGLVNGTNPINVTARDEFNNAATVWRNVTYDDPDRRRIEQLERDNALLQAQLDATNASLWQALADQNSSLLSALAGQNASLIARLLAQNASLLQSIADLNASLLAALAAQDASLTQFIADTNAALLAELTAGDAALTQLIADTNSSLLASLAAQNDALLQEIAATNATLFAELAAQNASLLDALAGQNASLLSALAAQDSELTQLIADTNASLLAELAAGDAALTQLIADTNTSLLASLAAQNDDLLARISSTNATLLAELAATNATLWARLTAENGALWASLNASRVESDQADSGQNSTITATQGDVEAVRAQAASASIMALVGTLIGAAGVAAALFAVLQSRKRPPSHLEGAGPAPQVEGVEVVDVGEGPADALGGPSRGTSMGAESEIRGGGVAEQRA